MRPPVHRGLHPISTQPIAPHGAALRTSGPEVSHPAFNDLMRTGAACDTRREHARCQCHAMPQLKAELINGRAESRQKKGRRLACFNLLCLCRPLEHKDLIMTHSSCARSRAVGLRPRGDIFETFCFADEWTFVPDHFAYSVEHIPAKAEAVKYMEVAAGIYFLIRSNCKGIQPDCNQ